MTVWVVIRFVPGVPGIYSDPHGFYIEKICKSEEEALAFRHEYYDKPPGSGSRGYLVIRKGEM